MFVTGANGVFFHIDFSYFGCFTGIGDVNLWIIWNAATAWHCLYMYWLRYLFQNSTRKLYLVRYLSRNRTRGLYLVRYLSRNRTGGWGGGGGGHVYHIPGLSCGLIQPVDRMFVQQIVHATTKNTESPASSAFCAWNLTVAGGFVGKKLLIHS